MRYWLARILFYGGLGAILVIIGWRVYLSFVLMFGDHAESWGAWQLRFGTLPFLFLALAIAGLGFALDFEKKLPGRRRPSE
jgi:hypothetical protein